MMPLSAHIFKGRFPLRQSGFTMLEILASIAIMAIAVLPLLGLIASTPALHMKKEQEVRATFLAELRLEEVKNRFKIASDLGIFGIVDYNKATGSSTDFTTGEGFKLSDAIYKYTISHGDETDIKTLTVEVWFDEDGSNTHNGTETSIILRTKVAKRRTSS
jgi:prepilin-type N-terminal cleavage/methylation domain-containing protein